MALRTVKATTLVRHEEERATAAAESGISIACAAAQLSQRRQNRVQIQEIFSDEEDEQVVLHVSTLSRRGIYISVIIYGRPLQFLLDTGSSVSIVEKDIFQKYFRSDAKIVPPPVTLLNDSRQRIEVLGAFSASVQFKTRSAKILFYIPNTGTSLLGMDALKGLNLQIQGSTMSCLYTEADKSVET